jgi:hypothetical protein
MRPAPRAGRLLRFGSALLVLCAPAGPAVAQESDCGTLRAMAGVDGRSVADLRLAVQTSGVSLGLEGRRRELPVANSCELLVETGEVEISCQWQLSNDSAAGVFFEQMLERLRRCLPSGFPRSEVGTQTPSWQNIRRNLATFVGAGRETLVELTLVESSHVADANLPGWRNYYVSLESTSEEISDEDEEDGEDEDQ